MNQWLKEHGREFVLSFLEKTTAKWLLGDMRARRHAKMAVLREVNASKPLRMALNDSLNKMPSIIQGLGRHIIKSKIHVLTKEKSFQKTLVIVPRAIVINDFTITLLQDLGQAAELKRFQALPETFLRRQAEQAEQVFLDAFSRDSHSVVVSASGIVLAADRQFDWHLGCALGHYYFGCIDAFSVKLTNKTDRKQFIRDIKPLIEEKMIQIGKLTSQEIDDTAQNFFKKKE